MVKSVISVMNVKLGVHKISTLQRKNRASLMNELSMQDKGVRTTATQIDSCFANRSHGQGIVVKKNEFVEGITDRIIASKKIKKGVWNFFKSRESDLALITAYAKLGIYVREVRKGLSSPIKGMAKRTFNVHLSKGVNWPSRVKGLVRNKKTQWLWQLWKSNDMIM